MGCCRSRSRERLFFAMPACFLISACAVRNSGHKCFPRRCSKRVSVNLCGTQCLCGQRFTHPFTTETQCTFPVFVDTKISPKDTLREGGVHGRNATTVHARV